MQGIDQICWISAQGSVQRQPEPPGGPCLHEHSQYPFYSMFRLRIERHHNTRFQNFLKLSYLTHNFQETESGFHLGVHFQLEPKVDLPQELGVALGKLWQ